MILKVWLHPKITLMFAIIGLHENNVSINIHVHVHVCLQDVIIICTFYMYYTITMIAILCITCALTVCHCLSYI